MPSTRQFRDYILDQLHTLNNITSKAMMGEFLLYYNGILFGGIYDDRLLIKITKSNTQYSLDTAIPYDNSKPMYMVDNIDDVDYLHNLIVTTYLDLKNKEDLHK